jgi:hypothetical protein
LIIRIIGTDLPIFIKGGMIFSFGQLIFRQIQVINTIVLIFKDL